MAILKVVFVRCKCGCSLLTDGWMVFPCLVSTAVAWIGFWWVRWVLNASSDLRKTQEGAWDCKRNESWGQACSHIQKHLPLMHNYSSPQTHLAQLLISGVWMVQDQTSRSQICQLLPWVWLCWAMAQLFLSSLHFQCNYKSSSGQVLLSRWHRSISAT